MNEEEVVVLLLMLKLLWKTRNMPSWRAILVFKRVRKLYFANILLPILNYYYRVTVHFVILIFFFKLVKIFDR